MNMLCILEEMWAETMESIQLILSGFCCYFAVYVSALENKQQNTVGALWNEIEIKSNFISFLRSDYSRW